MAKYLPMCIKNFYFLNGFNNSARHRGAPSIQKKFRTLQSKSKQLKFRKWFKYGLKAQKLLAQGIALGILAVNKAPCKGKSIVICLEF